MLVLGLVTNLVLMDYTVTKIKNLQLIPVVSFALYITLSRSRPSLWLLLLLKQHKVDPFRVLPAQVRCKVLPSVN
ncbi:hypothetical protein XENTR_v10009285 [Xenopus tropicalis]|nr:hypothetical protein XENTR_v10009285 [Xenopus tropicalis]